jgi:paraquat-inducible protein B
VNDVGISERGNAETLEEPELARRSVSFVWALPVVAVLAALWLAYSAFAERGPSIAISFRTAVGLEAGKTRIKHHDVELGVIQRIELAADLSHVTVHAQMQKNAEPHLKAGTKFWVVRPRLSGLNLSGLETLVSGAYVELDPGAGAPAREFVGLEEPPVVRSEVPGTEYVLRTDRLGGIGPGSPVFFRGVSVGEVTAYTYRAEAGIAVHVFVRKPYDDMVLESSRFWHASGIRLTTGPSGLKVELESLHAILSGGIAFETFDRPDQQKARAAAGTEFPLHIDRVAAEDAGFTRRLRALLEFDGSAHGLEIGAPVELRGIRVGRVIDMRLIVDAALKTARVPVTVELDFDRVGVVNQQMAEYGSGQLASDLVALGLRAQLRTASLVTGQLMVALDFFPDAPPAEIVATKPYPTLPTVASNLDALTRSGTELLAKLARLPLEEIAQDLRGVLGDARDVVASPELAASLRALNQTLAAAERLVTDAHAQSGPLLANLRRASEALDVTLKKADGAVASFNAGYGRDSQIRGELSELLRQLQESAKSVRLLATYLEQHPEALLRGKGVQR